MHETPSKIRRTRDHAEPRLLPPLAGGVICTWLIFIAIRTALRSRNNGDLLVAICPLLGATFLTIPAAQAWWACVRILRKR